MSTERLLYTDESKQSALAALSLGTLTAKECRERGIHLVEVSPEDFKPLPSTLYHVTTAAGKVKLDGLMSRFELAMSSGPGLSGGSQHSISLTPNLEAAEAIYAGLILGRKVAAGEITITEMLATAASGAGASRPWLDDMKAEYRSYGPDYLERLSRGDVYEHSEGRPPGLPPAEGDGWEPASKVITEDGQSLCRYWKRPLTADESQRRVWGVLRVWLATRMSAGGPKDPLFFQTNIKALAQVPEDEIAILECHAVPGAMGIFGKDAGIVEVRIYSGKAVKVVRKLKPAVGNRTASWSLEAAVDYEEMFWALLQNPTDNLQSLQPNVDASLKEWIKYEITWAKGIFKNNREWVTWWLRWARLTMEQLHSPELFAKDWAAYKRKAPECKDKDVLATGELGYERERISHFMGTPCPEIQAYRPGNKPIKWVADELRVIEKKWQETRTQVLKPQGGDKEIINFPNGWGWWLLDREHCTAEAKAMGHCGNEGEPQEGDRLLSLRQSKGRGEYEPHLTFVLRKDGTLGEMKGRSNDKPVPRYHPYIIELLKNPIVKGITGGGYLAENNFSLDDLPENERNQLEKEKPLLMPLREYVEMYGVTPDVMERVENAMTHGGEEGHLSWDQQESRYYLTAYHYGLQPLIRRASFIDERLIPLEEKLLSMYKYKPRQYDGEKPLELDRDEAARLQAALMRGNYRPAHRYPGGEGGGWGKQWWNGQFQPTLTEKALVDLFVSGSTIEAFIRNQEGPEYLEYLFGEDGLDLLFPAQEDKVAAASSWRKEMQQLATSHDLEDATKASAFERVVWERTRVIETNSLDQVGLADSATQYPSLQALHVGDPDFWFQRLVNDYGREPKAWVIEILPVRGDCLADDPQYAMADLDGNRHDSNVLVTRRKQLREGKDFRYVRELDESDVSEDDPYDDGETYGEVYGGEDEGDEDEDEVDEGHNRTASSKVAASDNISINVPGAHISGQIMSGDEFEQEWYVKLPFDRIALLSYVFVEPQHRREGIGGRLVKKFLKQARAYGAQACVLEVVPEGPVSMAELQQFYAALGFELVEINEEDHDNPPPLMILRLSRDKSAAYNEDAWKQTEDAFAGRWHEEETQEESRARYQRKSEWSQSALGAVSCGIITPEQATEQKLKCPYDVQNWDSFKPLPSPLYHVTTAASKVRQNGLLTRWEINLGSGGGLGGGTDKAISFTTDLKTAEIIYDAVILARNVSSGEFTIQDMVQLAKDGGAGVGRPWYDEFRKAFDSYVGGGEANYNAIMRGMELKGGVMPKLPEEMEGWTPIRTGKPWIGGDQLERYFRFERPFTPAELQEATWGCFKSWMAARQWAKGPMDPLFFGNDANKLKDLPESEIAILEFHPIPGAMGTQESALGEWRAYTGKCVQFVQEFKPSKTARKVASQDALPPEPGTAPIPAGAIRLWHYTRPDYVESIRQNGLLKSKGRGDDGKAQDVSAGVWASTMPPTQSELRNRPYVEFWAKPEEISPYADWPGNKATPEAWQTWATGLHHVILHGDVALDHIIAVHEPWQSWAHYLIDKNIVQTNPELLSDEEIADLESFPGHRSEAIALRWYRDHVKGMDKQAAPRGIWFHGSSAKNLSSILSQGLVPQVKQKNWDSDPDASMVTPSREAYGGIYVTTNLMTATGSPRDRVQEGRVVLVCMELQPNTFYMDEDNLNGALNQPLQHISDSAWHVIPNYIAMTAPGAPDWYKDGFKKFQDKYIEDCLKRWHYSQKEKNQPIHPELETRIREMLPGMWEAALTRLAAHAAKHTDDYRWKRSWIEVFPNADWDSIPEKADTVPSVAEGERIYREAAEKLTRTMRIMARPQSESAWNTARVATPIGYRGSNRITAVLEIRSGRKYREIGEEGKWYSNPVPIVVHYGEIPEDFRAQWKEREGSEIEVVDARGRKQASDSKHKAKLLQPSVV